MSIESFDPNKIDPNSIALDLESQAPGHDRAMQEERLTEPKILTLQFSNAGASLQFQTESEINNIDFVKLGDPMPGSLSIPLTPPTSAVVRKGTLTSKTYDHILNDPVMDKLIEDYEALSTEEKRIYDLILDKKIRNNFRKKSAKDININLSFALKTNNIKSFEFQSYLEQVTKQLELEGLWREENAEALESDVFAIDDVRDEDLDKNFDPKELHVIYNPKNMSTKVDSLQELKEQGLEWQDEIFINTNDLPELTTPTIHNLLRRAPWDIYETMARKLTEGSFFSNHPELEELLPCAYFVSKSIFARELFIEVKYETFKGTPLQKIFRTYTYRKFLKDQVRLQKLTDELLKKYFHQNPFVRGNVKKLLNEETDIKTTVESRLNTIWSRFFKVFKSLTKKQKNALAAIYTDEPKMTYEEAAAQEGISKDSFQDRIRGAIKKIKQVLPELGNLSAPKTYFKSKERNLLYNGLFCKGSAKKIHPVFKLDIETNERVEVSVQKNQPLKNRITPNKTAIRAWAIDSTPVPDVIFTDFYLGLIPEGHIRRKGGRSKFRG